DEQGGAEVPHSRRSLPFPNRERPGNGRRCNHSGNVGCFYSRSRAFPTHLQGGGIRAREWQIQKPWGASRSTLPAPAELDDRLISLEAVTDCFRDAPSPWGGLVQLLRCQPRWFQQREHL